MSSIPDEAEKLGDTVEKLFTKPFRSIDKAVETLTRRDISRSITRRIEALGARALRALRQAIVRFEEARSQSARRRAYNDVLRALYGRRGYKVLQKAVKAGMLSEEEVVELAKRKLRRKAARVRPARREKHIGSTKKRKRKKRRR